MHTLCAMRFWCVCLSAYEATALRKYQKDSSQARRTSLGLTQSLFLLRHGESEFNRQNALNRLFKKHRDSPLTPLGYKQAAEVARKLMNTSVPALAEVVEMRNADCVLVSPLTRAVQTVLVALAPIMEARPDLQITLFPDFREVVDMVHWDAIGAASGVGVVDRAIEQLRMIKVPEEELHRYKKFRVDARLAEGKWYNERSESLDELKARVQRIANSLKTTYNHCERIVMVGHSATIRALFNASFQEDAAEGYIPAWFRASAEEWRESLENGAAIQPSSHLRKKKLSNLGLARVDSAANLTNVRLLLDTRIVEVKDTECADGRGWRLDTNGVAARDGDFCACRWGSSCASSSTDRAHCSSNMDEWKYKTTTTVFNLRSCQQCICE